MKKYDVYGIGNALVDILVQVDDAFLNTVLSHPYPSEAGHTKGSMTLVSTEFQGHLLRLLENHQTRTVSGGSGANTVIGVAHLGGRAKYAGKVGNDVHGTFYVDDLSAARVHFDVPFHRETTGTCIVLVTPDAQRTMFTHLGCSIDLMPADIDTEAIKAAQWVYIEGYLWDVPGPRAAAMKMIETAHANGVKIACTFSDAFCVQRSLANLRAITKEYVDFVFCNEAEAKIFTGADNTESALRAIRELGCGAAITRGKDGSLVAYNGECHEIPAYVIDRDGNARYFLSEHGEREGGAQQALPVGGATRAPVIDTTGAGDLYAAGVLHGLGQGRGIRAAGMLGSKAAAHIVSVFGARLPTHVNSQFETM